MHRKRKRVAINLAAAINLLLKAKPRAQWNVAKRFAVHWQELRTLLPAMTLHYSRYSFTLLGP
jgi:hypothetical protein